MKLRIALLTALFTSSTYVRADIAPEITALQEGYGYIAKFPCLECPFLFQDTSKGQKEPWTERRDDNSLLLNITLPYGPPSVHINGRQIWPSSSILPPIYAPQVLHDISTTDLDFVISSGQLEASHETMSGGGFFGLSYRVSIHRVKTSEDTALLLRFDIFAIHTDLTTPPKSFKLEAPGQRQVEILLLPKPLFSALDPALSYEIVKVDLAHRPNPYPAIRDHKEVVQEMFFSTQDMFGVKGTPSHFTNSLFSHLIDYLNGGVFATLIFLVAVMALFVVVCLFCIFGCNWWKDDYQVSQHRKRGSIGRSGDIEMGSRNGGGRGSISGRTKGRFKTVEELGLLGRGRVVGVGKSD
ncbi:hypothetical protein P154DRAFT_191681 [Amniculicola lignicola CBS 123094]|uniref:Glycoside hydrolase family 16 protein n=1 Tax=Amniculicola lignicola CBS 123094 TaxID=1392246 RepID=A0A6A5WPF9_9PLEO|nr:hypothetical protein P154DRAFT_191681 [Amniculicola lignicola CBS 123094]